MSKNRVWVWKDSCGLWFVGVDVGKARLVFSRNTQNGESRIYVWLGGHEHRTQAAALRAAHRIGKALNLPVEVE